LDKFHDRKNPYPAFAQVLEWRKDTYERYSGFVMKTFAPNGDPISSIVHYLVTAKQDGYGTFGGESLLVNNSPLGTPTIVSGGSSSGGAEQGPVVETLNEEGQVAGDNTGSSTNNSANTTEQTQTAPAQSNTETTSNNSSTDNGGAVTSVPNPVVEIPAEVVPTPPPAPAVESPPTVSPDPAS
jgi:hypothetical protein